MPFIGNQPALSYTSFAVQHFTTSATTSYTLDYSVANENEIRLVINNVVQQPGSSYAYTASGTSLVLSSPTSSTDTMYAVFLGKAVQTVTPANNTITNAMLGETITVANGGTGATTLAGAGLSNTPSFLAYRSTDQSISDDILTKVEFDTEVYDTDNCYDNSTNYRFTPTVSGKYYVYSSIRGDAQADSNIQSHSIRILKNGSNILTNVQNFQTNYPRIMSIPLSFVVDMNGSTDYLEIHYRMNDTSGNPIIGATNFASYFGAYKLIGV